MRKYEIEKIYIKTKAQDIASDLMANMLREAPDDLITLMRAGCTIDTVVQNGILKISTRFPVSILKTQEGKAIHVIEYRK